MSFEKLSEYDSEFLVKLLNQFCTNKNYLHEIHDAIDVKYFYEYADNWVVTKILEYYKKYNTNPTVDFFSAELKKFKSLDEKNKPLAKEIKDILNRVYGEEFEGVEFVRDEFSNFCKQQSMTNVILNSPDMIKAGRYDDLVKQITLASRIGEKRLNGHDFNNGVEDRYREEDNKFIPMLFDEFNELFPEKLGIASGSVVINLGASSSGKSMIGVAWASLLLKLGYDVLYFNLESHYKFVAKRFDSCLNNIPLDEISFNRERIQETLDSLEGRLHIKDCIGIEKGLDFMKNYTRKLEEEQGFIPKFIIVDYVNKMLTPKGSTDETGGQKTNWANIIDWAKEIDTVIYSPSPIGRGAIKDKVIYEDSVAGSINAIYDCDFIFSWSMSQVLRIIKNKNGKGGGTNHQISMEKATSTFKYIDEYFEEDDKISTKANEWKKKLLNKN
jgi:hypothetical protein